MESTNETHTKSQLYLSTRGGESGLSFEAAVLKGLAADGGLFLPHEVPIATDWRSWKDLSYADLAFRIFRLYISQHEIPSDDLKVLIDRTYSSFRAAEVAPLRHLQDRLYLLELFYGPSYSFKDYALQFLGHVFEYFLIRRNRGKEGKDRYHLTIIGATSGDTGSAAICGLRSKKDVSVVILHPKGRCSPIQEAQMTTCLDKNVHNIAVEGTFDDCQSIVKDLFSDPDANQSLNLGTVNSINVLRILAQIVYYFHSYFLLSRKDVKFKIGDRVRFVTPTGNFGNILAGYFAKLMGLPIDRLVVATNENDILHRFWTNGRYEKSTTSDAGTACKQTLSPAMDILVSSNFERLLWFLCRESAASAGIDDNSSKKQANQQISAWYRLFKADGRFGPVDEAIMALGRSTFESDRISDPEILATIRTCFAHTKYILDPHTAVGVAAAHKCLARANPPDMPLISLSTAHPAKFSHAIELALRDEADFDFDAQVLPAEFKSLLSQERRVVTVENSWELVREIIKTQVEQDRSLYIDCHI